MTVIIRPLNKNELLPMELLLLADPDREKVNSYLEKDQLIISECHQQVIGVLVLGYSQSQAEIKNVAVSEQYQGKGVATLLVEYAVRSYLKALKSQAQNSQDYPLYVKTGETSLPAIKVYTRCGFKEVKREANYFVQHYSEPIYEFGQLLKDQLIFQYLPD